MANSHHDYYFEKSCFERRVLFLHSLKLAENLKDAINRHGEGHPISKEELVNARMGDDPILNARNFLHHLRDSGADEFTSGNLLRGVIEGEKGSLTYILISIVMESAMILLGLLSFQALIHQVSRDNRPTP